MPPRTSAEAADLHLSKHRIRLSMPTPEIHAAEGFCARLALEASFGQVQ
jgi:hypothetical protein